jgi:hypothetical protein
MKLKNKNGYSASMDYIKEADFCYFQIISIQQYREWRRKKRLNIFYQKNIDKILNFETEGLDFSQ